MLIHLFFRNYEFDNFSIEKRNMSRNLYKGEDFEYCRNRW